MSSCDSWNWSLAISSEIAMKIQAFLDRISEQFVVSLYAKRAFFALDEANTPPWRRWN